MSEQSELKAELLPCPFCGGTNIKLSANRGTGINGHAWCDNDSCCVDVYGSTRDEAIKNWNTRHPAPLPDEAIQKAREAIKDALALLERKGET